MAERPGKCVFGGRSRVARHIGSSQTQAASDDKNADDDVGGKQRQKRPFQI